MRPKRARGAAPNLSGATRWIPASGQDKGKVELHVGEAGLPAAPLIGFADSCHIQEGESHWLFSLFHSSWGVLVQFAISIDSLRTPFMETLGDFHGATARWLNERGVAPQPLAEQVPASACAHAPYLVNHLMLSRTGLDAQMDGLLFTPHSVARSRDHRTDVQAAALFSVNLPLQVVLGMLNHIADRLPSTARSEEQ